MSRVLVMEDEPAMLRGLTDVLRREGYDVHAVTDGEAGYEWARAKRPDLIVLDLMLPKMSGYEVCRKLRSEADPPLIMMLTARAEEADRVLGLDLGADDYVTKPFSLREFLARVRALLRRSRPAPPLPDQVQIEAIVIDFRRYEANKAGQPLEMTRREFQLLRALVSRPGEVISRSELLDQVWGLEAYPTTRTIDNHIAGLRAKIEREPAEPQHLLTIRGVGYKWIP